MSADSPISFIDSNIVVYALAQDDAVKAPIARTLLDGLATAGSVRLSTQVLQESYVNLTRKGKRVLSPSAALAALDLWAEFPIVQIDYTLIRAAANFSASQYVSFGDALILVAAARAGAKRLYTEDLQHGRVWDGVEVVNPFLAAKPNL